MVGVLWEMAVDVLETSSSLEHGQDWELTDSAKAFPVHQSHAWALMAQFASGLPRFSLVIQI